MSLLPLVGPTAVGVPVVVIDPASPYRSCTGVIAAVEAAALPDTWRCRVMLTADETGREMCWSAWFRPVQLSVLGAYDAD